MRTLFQLFALTAIATCVIATSLHAQRCPVRGVVVSADAQPIANASIRAETPAGGATSVFADLAGRFTLSGEESWRTLSVRALGYSATSITLPDSEPTCLATLVVKLQPAITQLGAVKVIERRRIPEQRRITFDRRTTERSLLSSGTSASEGASVSDAARNAVGVAATDAGGFSALGAGADQNAVTIDGMRVDDATLPPGAAVLARISASPFDPARGDFSGAALSITSAPATGLREQRIRLSSAATSMPSNAGSFAALAPIMAFGMAGGGTTPVTPTPFLATAHVTRQTIPVFPFAATGPSPAETDLMNAARALGIAADDVRQPMQSRTAFSAMLRTDPAPIGAHTIAATYVGSGYRVSNLFVDPRASIEHGGASSRLSQLGQLEHSIVVGSSLFESAIAWHAATTSSVPTSRQPEYVVRLDAPDSIASSIVSLGGHPAADAQTDRRALQARSKLSRYVLGNRHLLTLTLVARSETTEEAQPLLSAGSFGFPSANAFRRGVADSYVRATEGAKTRTRLRTAALSVSDDWAGRNGLRALVGLRVDAAAFDVPSMDASPGAPAIREMAMSPRAVVTWTPSASPDGSDSQGGLFLRLGAGRFHGLPSVTAMRAVGQSVAGGGRMLICNGERAPYAPWASDSHADQCAASSVAVEGVRSTATFDPSFRSPDSWRVVGSMSVPMPGLASLDIESTVALGRNQLHVLDDNLHAVPAFILPSEGGRQVLIPRSAVTGTGRIDASAARRDPLSGPSLRYSSGLASHAHETTVTMSGLLGNRSRYAFSFTRQRVREQVDAFSSVGAAHGADVEWSTATNEVPGQYRAFVERELAAGIRAQVHVARRSGFAFTPMVESDINGDGVRNDRAFIFDGSDGVGTALAGLATRGGVYECLKRQRGRIATRNSCRGEPATDIGVALQLSLGALRTPLRSRLNVRLDNLLAAADMIRHGATGRVGWGDLLPPDPVLLVPVGFDQGIGAFTYRVNPQFGLPRGGVAAFPSPARAQVVLELSLGALQDDQRLARALGRPEALSAEALHVAFGMTGATVVRALIADQTSILTSAEREKLATLATEFEQDRTRVWSRALDAVRAEQRTAHAAAIADARLRECDAYELLLTRVRVALSAESQRRMSPAMRYQLDERSVASMRRRALDQSSGF